MFTHVMIASNDLERARDFYDATFAALGGRPGEMDDSGKLIYIHDGSRLMITTPIDDKPATAATLLAFSNLDRVATGLGCAAAAPNSAPGRCTASEAMANRGR